MMDDDSKSNTVSNLLSAEQWLRLVFMLLFSLALQVALPVMWVVVVIQFLFTLITGSNNLPLRRFGVSLSAYMYQIFQFLTYNTDDKPFPFSDWPDLPQRQSEEH